MYRIKITLVCKIIITLTYFIENNNFYITNFLDYRPIRENYKKLF